MTFEITGFLLIILLSLGLGFGLSSRQGNPFPQRLILLAVALRIAGSLARYDMMRAFYGGISDAARYYNFGEDFARRAWSFDFSVFGPAYWFGGPDRWWGTEFMEKLSGVVVTFTGPTMRGEFLVFSMLAFLGLYLIALAVHRVRPGPGAVRFAGWIWVWPSLWFWPSSVGKEAVTVLAIGVAFYGYVGRNGRTRWLPFAAGTLLAFALRPHVAAVLALAVLAAYWLQSWHRPTARKVLESVVMVAVAFGVLIAMTAELGVDADLEGVQEYMDHRSDFTLRGGSSLESVPDGVAGIPMAFVNIWLRPFPWEAHNAMAFFAALEVVLLWWLAWRNRRFLRASFSAWRKDRLLAFAVTFLTGYTVVIGLTFGNLGIIARQRTPMFPFIFLLLTGGGYILSRHRRQVPRHTTVRFDPGRS